MNIVIKELQQTVFSYDDVVRLLHESFVERQEQGLQFTCYTITVEEYKEKTKDGKVFVAFDADTNVLWGTVAMSFRTDDEGVSYIYHYYLAVAPTAKHQGIGSLLYVYIEREGRILGAQYILSDTAEGAMSSVRYHLKQGFKIVGYDTFCQTNYYSYIFRKSLNLDSEWSEVHAKWTFLIAYIKIRIKYHVHREPTFLYRMYRKIVRQK